MLSILVTHMTTKGTCEIIISLQDGCSFYNFGRRKTCNFSFDDEHLSGIHARIFILHNQFVIEDLHSTNGTWLRLSHPN
jgi:pSer/pThr/pTyr-binding forkhead associated (FHA) protein